ncbi:choice-of-anchor L domain-containing protein [Marinifilum sp. RC60d5]|uniref:choice-of-anchor L domain-containing protein n=1 Tax=Marinifilum sp. RC60d5 TaxID=3458414 RepID=UPI00403519F0
MPISGHTNKLVTGGENFYDSGGASSNYEDGEDGIITLKSALGTTIRVTFTIFQLRKNGDYLDIYDGDDTSATLIGTYNHNASPGEISSSSNSITFRFSSNSNKTKTGWTANVEVVSGSSGGDYCESSGNVDFDTGVTLVDFNTINNSSSMGSGYTDYTSIFTDVSIGSSYNLTVNVNTDGNYRVKARAWIDWNQDGDFADSNEEFDLGGRSNTSDGATSESPYSITVPSAASLGETRMRVSAKYNSYPGVCEDDFDGEVEDYTLNVISIVGNPPIANCKDLTVQLDASGNASVSAADINNSSSDGETADADLILSIDKTNFDCDDLGSQTVTLTVEDEDGNESTCTANVTVEDNVAPSLLNLNAEYHDGMSMSDLKYSEAVDEIHTNWGNGSPNTGLVGNDEFSIKYSGSFVVPVAGDYTFYTNSDDGVRLSIDGSYVIQNWDDHAPESDSGTVGLSKGEHTILLEYYEKGGGAVIELEWESSDAGIAKDVFSKSSILNNTIVETTLKLDDSGNATLAAADVDPGFIDNCGVVSQKLSKSNFSSSDIGENTVVLTVKDASGNSNTINVGVTVESADPSVSLSVGSNFINENGGSTNITASIPSAYTDDIIVNLAYSGGSSSDYSAANQIVIPAGSTSAYTGFTAVNNDINDGDRDVTVEISLVTNGTASGTQEQTITIVDDDLPSTASININNQDASIGTSANDLVQNVLVTGCLIANNVTYTGDQTNGIGYFEQGDSDFPLSSGVILSTGKVENAIGPASRRVSDYNSGFDFNTKNLDSDLMALAGTELRNSGWPFYLKYWIREYNDAQILEFDFVPAGNKLEFNYIFASEEYNGYACSDFNDGFAFILSGPGIGNDPGLSGKNIALTESGDQVSINNVYKNQCEDCPDNSEFYVEEIGGHSIAFDGRTKILTARADVTSCETYHIKLIVYDRNDKEYNSAVFLEAKSFKSNEVTVENKIDGIEGDKEIMYRGCDKSYISFTRKEEIDKEYSFHVSIGGSAENGVDYYEVDEYGTKLGKFPEEVTFAAGETEIKIYYMASDEVTGSKDILFEVLKGCPCSADDDDYYKKHIDIIDVAQIEAEAISNVRCNGGDPVSTIIIQLAEGLVSTNYLYSLDGRSFQEENKFQGTYTVGEHIVTIKDKFSCSSEDITIDIPKATDLDANAGVDFDMCQKDTKTLNGTGGIDYLWTCNKAVGLDGMDVTSPTPSISPDLPADIYVYTLTVSDGVSDLCSSSDDVEVTVKPTPVINGLDANRLEVCSGQEIILTASISNGINPTYKWTPNNEINGSSVGLSATIQPVSTVLASRTINFTVTSDNSCSASQSISGVKVFPNPSISLLDATSNLCADGNNGEIHIEATGGTPNMEAPFYNYEWSHDSGLNSPDATTLGVDTYTIKVTDAKTCSDTKTYNVTAQPKPKGIFFTE